MELSKEEFEAKYNSMTNKELAEELNVSMTTITSYVKKLGIAKKGSGRRANLIITGAKNG